MLVLTRKLDESIVIDGQITVTVLKVKGNTIRLGIEAPNQVPVRRGELQPFLAEELDAECTAEATLVN